MFYVRKKKTIVKVIYKILNNKAFFIIVKNKNLYKIKIVVKLIIIYETLIREIKFFKSLNAIIFF